MKPTGLFLFRMTLFLGLLLLAGGTLMAGQPGSAVTVVLVRHAERASLLAPDSPLSAQGHQRADGLAYFLDQFHPDALFASSRIRTQETLRPLAQRLHLPVTVWDFRDSASLGSFLRTRYPGRCVLVCWHHDLMPELARSLGVQGSLPVWSMFTFDKIWIVTLEPDGRANLRETREWGPS